MLDRWIEDGLLDALDEDGRRLHRLLPAGAGPAHRPLPRTASRRTRGRRRAGSSLVQAGRSPTTGRTGARAERDRRSSAGRRLAQLALAWVLRDPRVTSALVGASSVAQLEDNVAALQRLDFAPEELAAIDRLAPRGA